MRSLYKAYMKRNRALLQGYRGGLHQYKEAVKAHVCEGQRILHIGCGWDGSRVIRPYQHICDVVGVDLDERSAEGYPGDFWLSDARNLPFADHTFDLAVSEYVLEHVEEPKQLLAEVARVLRPGGHFIVLTPNVWSYKALAAAATPHTFHIWAANHLRLDTRAEEDVFPTFYRMNRVSTFLRLAREGGLSVQSIQMVSNGPTWFQAIPGLFECGQAYHWLIEHMGPLAFLRCNIVADFLVPGPPEKAKEPAYRCTRCNAESFAISHEQYTCRICGKEYKRSAQLTSAL